MKKRLILLLAMVMLLLSLTPAAYALEDRHIADGTCGDGITWSLDGYTLTITGSGDMEDGAPWSDHKDRIEHVVLTGGVTKIGKDAFYKYDRIETVDFGDALVEVGERAFYGCEDIDYIHMPASFKRFGAECFRGCTSLKYVYCDGGMPRFSSSCLWSGGYISVFYPTNNPWPAESVNQLVHNFGGKLGIMMGNFDPSVVGEFDVTDTEEAPTEAQTQPPETTEATEAVQAIAQTEAPTEPAIAETTEPETEPTEVTTVPTTEETTVPITEETTVPATEEETEPPAVTFATEAPAEPQETLESKSWIGIVLIAGVLTFLIVGALIFRIASRRGRRYR